MVRTGTGGRFIKYFANHAIRLAQGNLDEKNKCPYLHLEICNWIILF